MSQTEMRPSVLTLAGLLLLVPLLTWSTTARAYDDETGIALGFGYLGAPVQDLQHGPVFEATLDTAISDTWTLRAQGAYGRMRQDGDRSHLLRVGVEAIYIVDIIDWVPFIGGGADVIGWSRGGELHVGPALHTTLGIDYLLSRVWSVGFAVRIFAGPPHTLDPFSLVSATLSVRYVLTD